MLARITLAFGALQLEIDCACACAYAFAHARADVLALDCAHAFGDNYVYFILYSILLSVSLSLSLSVSLYPKTTVVLGHTDYRVPQIH